MSMSCLDYLRQGARTNGRYLIQGNNNGNLYEAYCDFNSEPLSAWTLVLSFARKNRKMDEFCNKELTKSYPRSKHDPNWEAYRQSLTRMKLIAQVSTHFRATTDFEKVGVDFRDYLRANISGLDVLTESLTNVCKKVEYINIRGITGVNTEINVVSSSGYLFHTDSSNTICAYKSNQGSVLNENNFGFYCEADSAMNMQFRGTANEDSTTQFWFGGYL